MEEIAPDAWNTCKCVNFKGNTNKTSKFCLQAQKRKLGLLEEDGDLKQLTNSISNRQDDFVKKILSSIDASRYGMIHGRLVIPLLELN